MTKKKNSQTPSKTKAAEAEKPPAKEDVKKPESNPTIEHTKDEKHAFPLYTLLAAGTVIVATFVITNTMAWPHSAKDTNKTAHKNLKPSVHIMSEEGNTGELTPFEIDNILSGNTPVTPTPKPLPESFKAMQSEQASHILPPQDALQAEQDALEDMIDDASDSVGVTDGESGQNIKKIERKFSKLSNKVKNLRTENRSLKRQVEMLKKQQHHITLNAAVSGLNFAITNGDNFEASLMQLANMRDTPLTISRGIATLDALPTRQVSKAEELAERLTQTARDYLHIASTNEDASVWDKTIHNLTSSIHIRKVGTNHQGDDDGAIIARAEAQIDSGDIDEALAELDQLSPNAAEFFASWVTLAKEHQTANTVAGRMVKHLAQGDAL